MSLGLGWLLMFALGATWLHPRPKPTANPRLPGPFRAFRRGAEAESQHRATWCIGAVGFGPRVQKGLQNEGLGAEGLLIVVRADSSPNPRLMFVSRWVCGKSF